jgi:cytidyltransferase-like protein
MSTTRKTTGALGGTFDHFHRGHEHFLEFAAKQANKLLIGVTDQSLINEKELSAIIEPYEVRSQAVRTFCKQKNIPHEIVQLTDPFGPTLGQREVDRLIVTELTVQGGEVLNRKRKEKGLESLPTFICSMLRDESGQILNSTRIRQGVVNRQGVLYASVFVHPLVLSDEQKHFFKKPLGKFVPEPESEGTIVAVVGDVCLVNFEKNHWRYSLGVYDLVSQRQPATEPLLQTIAPEEVIANPAGTIQPEVSQKLQALLQRIKVFGQTPPRQVLIRGEEDLVTAVLLLLLPLQSLIYYGQPGEGMVEVVVSEELKEKIFTFFNN